MHNGRLLTDKISRLNFIFDMGKYFEANDKNKEALIRLRMGEENVEIDEDVYNVFLSSTIYLDKFIFLCIDDEGESDLNSFFNELECKDYVDIIDDYIMGYQIAEDIKAVIPYVNENAVAAEIDRLFSVFRNRYQNILLRKYLPENAVNDFLYEEDDEDDEDEEYA